MTTPATPAHGPTKPYKAIVAGVLSFLGALYFQLQGRETLDSMTVEEWLMVLLAALITSGATWSVPNPPAGGGGRLRRDAVGAMDPGSTRVLAIAALVIAVVLLLILLL